MNEKREQGLLISCSAGLASLVFLIVVYYLRKTEELDFQTWDINNLTSSDFTVEYKITEQMWDLFNV